LENDLHWKLFTMIVNRQIQDLRWLWITGFPCKNRSS